MKPVSRKFNWDSTLNLPRTTLPIRATLNDEIYREAVSTKLYEKLASRSNAPEFNLTDGPPFANGDLHVGHALNKLLKDTILRSKGAQGHKINFRPAWDCHGLPIEIKALQHAQATNKMDAIEIRKLCRKFALQAIDKQKQSMQKWGLLADYNKPLLTMDPQFEANQLQVLAAMVEKDLIYSAKKPVFYSPSSQTALAEAELEYSDQHVSLSAFIRFKALLSDIIRSKLPDKSKNVCFIAWTTTPWTLPSNKALAVGKDIIYSLVYSSILNSYLILARSRIPLICSDLQHSLDTIISDFCVGADLSDSKYESLQFSPSEQPNINPVILGDFVTDDSGSGIVHLAPDYGTNDFEACKSAGISPNAIDLLDKYGNFNSTAPSFLSGLNIFSGASETILEYLKCTGHFLSSSYYTHRYPYDWRTGKPVIQRATRQWFASISSIIPQLENSIEKVQFIPENGKDKMLKMLKSRTEWCISRQRHWGLPIPAIKINDQIILDPSVINNVSNIIKLDPTGSDVWWTHSISALSLKKYNDDYEKRFDTLDVWFDSGTVWNNFREKADLYLEGSDQYRGWFQSSLITSVSVKEEAPYKTVLTHGFVLDQKGQKMSKSIGNVVNPDEIVEKYGSDVLRLWALSANFKNDVNMGTEIINQVAETKRKIRNTLRFILGNLKGYEKSSYNEFRWIDKLMLARLKEFNEACKKSMESYDFPSVVQQLCRFCVQDLSAFYFEILKDRLYTEPFESPLRQGAQEVLIQILNVLIGKIELILPFLSEEIKNHQQNISEFSEDDYNFNLDGFEWIQKIRSDFLEWFNTTGKSELKVKSTFQLDLKIVAPFEFRHVLTFEDFKEIFMVADVELIFGDKFQIHEIKASERFKCPRCWTFNSIEIEELCPSCIKQIGRQSIEEQQDIAMTCIILASKVEESFEKIKTVLATAFLCLDGNSYQGRTEDIKITEEHKDRVIQYERDVLIAVAFKFNLSHPHHFLLKLSKSLGISKETARKGWDFLNVWYETEDFVLWKAPHLLALEALMAAAGSGEKEEVKKIMDFTFKNSIKLP